MYLLEESQTILPTQQTCRGRRKQQLAGRARRVRVQMTGNRFRIDRPAKRFDADYSGCIAENSSPLPPPKWTREIRAFRSDR